MHLLVFHPRDAAPAALQALLDAGWSTTDIVTLSQIVAFLSFQIRVVAGLRVLAGRPDREVPHARHGPGSAAATRSRRSSPARSSTGCPGSSRWRSRRLTERHMASLVDAARAKSPYFRLLARDPDALEARTRTDKDIFYNPDAGLPRAERELAAAATSRFNGCIYCASVHARYAATYSKREADVQRLLDDGVGADLGERWNAIVAASVALTRHADRLRAASTSSACAAPASTTWRSPTSSTPRRSSTGPTG